MRFYGHEKLALVVDGQHTLNTAKSIKLDLDWGKIAEFFGRQAIMVTTRFFTPMQEGPAFNPNRPLADWLEFHGWQVVTQENDTAVEMTVDVMEMSPWVDHFVLATGDAMFVPLVDAIKRKGRRVTILASLKAGSDSCEEELRRAADDFMDLNDLRSVFARTPRETVSQ